MTSSEAPAASSQSNGQGLAVVAIILAVLGLICVIVPLRIFVDLVGILLSVGSAVCGHISMARSRTGSQTLSIVALVLGYAVLVVGIVHFVDLLALEHFLRRLRGGTAQ